MPFQFLCPQGHLLQGDEAHMGMQTQCPQCGTMFIIPTIEAQAPQVAQQEAYVPHDLLQAPAGPYDHLSHEPEYEVSHEHHEHVEQPIETHHAADVSHEPFHDEPIAPEEATPGIVHIPCPNGHELETPVEMLGEEVLCPHCGAQFQLKREDSREYHEEQEKLDAERARVWFNWAIFAAVVIGGGLLVLLVVSMLPKE